MSDRGNTVDVGALLHDHPDVADWQDTPINELIESGLVPDEENEEG